MADNESSTAVLSSAHPGATQRKDAWWVEPLLVVLVLGSFGIYTTFRAFQNDHYLYEPYLTPFSSPLLLFKWWHFSPAILILPFPLVFRATCYYYRKAYYRAFFLDPPACAVGEPMRTGKEYCGETKFPFILQNIHRYTFYAAAIILAVLWWDAFKAFIFNGHFGIGVGTLIMVVNCVLLSLYTFSCHSWRHLIGGRVDCISECPKLQSKAYHRVSFLNENHMRWAWLSLFSVAITDIYIYLLSLGVLHDVRFF